MHIHEFGKQNEMVILLIHPSLVRWDYFESVIPFLQEEYHLIVPALPGYDPQSRESFTSVEQIAEELADALQERKIEKIACVYGCSMGASIAIRMLAERRIRICCAVLDGGITPYQLPRFITRCIAVRDLLLVSAGKAGGLRLLQRAFSEDEYGEEDLRYLYDVLRHMSLKTIWNTFDSCNNYRMPEVIKSDGSKIEYWYALTEKKDRKWDIRYIRKIFPKAVFLEFEGIGHGGLAVKKPALLASQLKRVIGERNI